MKLLLLATIGIFSSAFSQLTDESYPYAIRMKSRVYVPAVDTKSLVSSFLRNDIRPTNLLTGKQHALVQFYDLPNEANREKLKSSGIILHDYVPDNAFFVSVDPSITESTLVAVGVRNVSFVNSSDKIEGKLLRGLAGADEQNPLNIYVYVLVYPDVVVDDAKLILEMKMDAEVISRSEDFKVITVKFPRKNLERVAQLEWIQWIEAVLPFENRNDGSRSLINVNELQASPYLLTGDGLRLGMWDSGQVYAHDAFLGRLVVKTSTAVGAHSTHVAGTMAGNGANSTDRYRRGMSTLAEIYSYSYLGKSWDTVATEMKNAVTNDIIVLSQNSWGDNGGGGMYTIGARLMDQVVKEKNIPIVFSVGYGGHGYNAMWSPEVGKNLIAVTAVTKQGGDYTYPSSGPCADGRLKPDICAAGVDIYSTSASNGYASLTGTSMAAPAISGTLGLMIERYKQRNSGAMPMPSLLKAILLNTATDIGNPGPDYLYGYGIANALEAVKMIDAVAYFTNSVSQGITQSYTIHLASGVTQLKVMLAYTDPEASVNANPALINNLDLVLVSPSQTTFLPYTLNPTNPSANAVQDTNKRDNVEQVALSNPSAGTWTIRITASTVPTGPQTYAVSWYIPRATVTVDQKLQDATTSIGSVDRWNNNQFVNLTVPHTTAFDIGKGEVLRGDQSILSSQKYNRWNNESDVTNHHVFLVSSQTNQLTSNLKTNNNATVQAELLDDGTPSALDFKDPWLIDYPDTNYGNNLRNQGTSAPFKSVAWGTHNLGTSTSYKGIFLNQGWPNWNPPYYSIRALLTQPNMNGFTGCFVNWDAAGAQVQNANSADSQGVVFNQVNAVVTAKYKAHLGTWSSSGTASNNQRKIAQTENGTFCLVYESVGRIWFTTSTDGTNWSNEVEVGSQTVTDGEYLGEAYPSLAFTGNIINVVWQRMYYDYFEERYVIEILLRRHNVSNNTWDATETVATFSAAQENTYAATPVVDGILGSSSSNDQKMVAWRSRNGIDVAMNTYGSWSPVATVTGTNSYSMYPALLNYNGYAYSLVWQDSQNETIRYIEPTYTNSWSFPCAEQVSPSGWVYNSHPSLAYASQYSTKPTITWQSSSNIVEGTSVHVRQRSGVGSLNSWGASITSFSSGSSATLAPVIGSYAAIGKYSVVWSVDGDVYAANYNGSSWSGPNLVASGTSGGTGVSINAQSPSTLKALWRRADNHIAFNSSSVNPRIVTEGGGNGTISPILANTLGTSTGGGIAGTSVNVRHNRHVVYNVGNLLRDEKAANAYVAFEMAGMSLTSASGTQAIALADLDSTSTGRTAMRSKAFIVPSGLSSLTFAGAIYGNGFGGAVKNPLPSLKALAAVTLIPVKQPDRAKNLWSIPVTDVNEVTGQSFGTFKKLSVSTKDFAGETVIAQVILPALDQLTPILVDDYLILSTPSASNLPVKGENEQIAADIPTAYALYQNFPNPFNPSTEIAFDLPNSEYVTLTIYNLLGEEVLRAFEGYMASGRHGVTVKLNTLSSGTYLYRLSAGTFNDTKRMTLLK